MLSFVVKLTGMDLTSTNRNRAKLTNLYARMLFKPHKFKAWITMNANNPIDDLVKQLLGALPQGMADLREDAQRNFRAILAAGLQRLDLVTRDEFEAQRAVLDKARDDIKALHQKLDALLRERDAPQ
jgi:BMFP domain-containing protein YqiC